MNVLLIDLLVFYLYSVLYSIILKAFHYYNYYSNYTRIRNVLIMLCPIHSRYLTYLPTNSTQETNITMTILVSNTTYLSNTIIIVLETHGDYRKG